MSRSDPRVLDSGEHTTPHHDFRMPALAAVAWLAGVAATQLGPRSLWLAAGAAAALGAHVGCGRATRRRGRRRVSASLWLLCGAVALAAAVIGSTLLRHSAVAHSPMHGGAEQRATADLTATVVSDPRRIKGQWADQVVVRLRVHEVSARGHHLHLGGAVVVLGDPAWSNVELGEEVLAEGRLAPSDDPTVTALLTGARPPTRIRGPDVWWRASGAVRASIRQAVAHRPADQAGLVPALVDGDVASLPTQVESNFRVTGLTHLTAVSGTNLTLVVGALLLAARALGVRRRWLTLVGLLGIVGFVLLARTEPSVLRAAAMGLVGLFAFGTDGRRRGLRALAVAVTGLVLLDPGLSTTIGFALSVLATAGIVLLGPPLSVALGRWLPGGLAEALAIPTAAQLACTPLIAVISGQVSMVAIVANLLAEPAVGPATVLGLLAGLVGLLWSWLGSLLGTGAAWCVGWIITVAERGAALPGAVLDWGTGPFAILGLVLLCLVCAVSLPWLMSRRRLGITVLLLVSVTLLGLPGRLASLLGPSWPPPGWVLVACDVGQGDGLVLATGPGSAIVIDAGPDPDAIDGCLDRLGIDRVPLVVLTHFHADHVDGLEGVLRGRRVEVIQTSAVMDPPSGVRQVTAVAREADVPLTAARFGDTRQFGQVRLQVLHPELPPGVEVPGAGDGSSANDASVVLLVEVAGLRILLTGDVEPPGQSEIADAVGDLDIDVLKVPHHGSAHQDLDWLESLHAEVALISVGKDNDYGHPAPDLIRELSSTGAQVHRTDVEGDIAVVVDQDGDLGITDRG
ncbi:MAG: ComEC/Rec2 family competence protein [Nocardioidaceae bacterium]|nr:ComEC/Rec2 family competence protein [Nocardioidaceae bacterium]